MATHYHWGPIKIHINSIGYFHSYSISGNGLRKRKYVYPLEATSLVQKSEAQRFCIPADPPENYMRIAQERQR